MKEWSSELYPQLILLNSKSKGFVTKFNSYYPTLKSFVDNKEDREGFSDRLEVLQEMAMTNQENTQRQINELTDLKLQLDKKLKDFDTNVATAQGILSTDGTGKIDQLKNEILNTKKAIQNDLQQIALIPGALNEQGFAIFKEVYSLSKEIIEPAAQAGVAAYNKGKEINNSILEAEKKAVQEATEQGKTALEIESAKKAAREAIEKSKQGEIAAAAAAKTQEYDLMKVIDTEKIKKTFGVFAEVNKLTAEQRAYLDDLEKQNQTYAVRDTEIDGVAIQKDDFMCIADGKIVSTNAEKVGAAKQLLEALIDEDSEIVTILQGEDATDEEVAELVEFVEEKFEDAEVEVHAGNQPVYSFIFSVE